MNMFNKKQILTLVLTMLLFFSIVVELRAEDEIPTSGTCNDAGTCLWSLSSDGTMTISAKPGYKNVAMKDYSCSGDGACIADAGNRPWEANISNIKNLVVGDNISVLGANAFQNATALVTVTGMKDVKTLNTDVFWYATSLESVYMPKVEYIGNGTFYKTNLESVDIPNAKKIIDQAFRNAENLSYLGIPDGVKMIDGPNGIFGNTKIPNCGKNGGSCGSCGNGYVMSGLGCVSECGNGYLGKEGRCIDSSLGCGAGYRQFEDFCNRIQYTPAEAAKVLRDDNTNEVTITFRK